MNVKTTIVAAIVAAALGAYIYVYEREPVEDADSTRERVFGELDPEGLELIEIEKAEGEAVRVVKTDEGWRIESPTEAPASETEVSTLARNVAELERERVLVEAQPGETLPLDDYGLSHPRFRIRFRAAGDETPRELLIGDKTPTGSNLYAKLADEDRVFVIPSYLEYNFDKDAWDLRDRSVLAFERDDVQRIVLERPEGRLVLARAGEDRWNVTTPSLCRAERYKASGLLSQLETAKMEEIVSESEPEPDRLADYGLDAPRYRVRLELEGGATAELLVGGEKDGRFYARNPDRPLVYLVAKSLVDEIGKDAGEFRSKRLFDYATYRVHKLRIAKADEPARVATKLEAEGEGGETRWKQTEPEERDLDRSAVEDLLYKMNGTDADDFATLEPTSLAEWGLEPPLYRITVWSKEDDEEETSDELLVSAPRDDNVYARRKGDVPVLRIALSKWQEIEKLMSLEKAEETDEGATEEGGASEDEAAGDEKGGPGGAR